MGRVRASRPALAAAMGIALAASVACADDLAERLAEAERLRAEAAEAGAEWRDTESLLDEARAAAARGDTDTAEALAEHARFQAEAAIRQAEHEAQAWEKRVVR